MGLSKGFKQGRIICTPITAALVRLKLRVPAEKLVVVQLGQQVTVEGERPCYLDGGAQVHGLQPVHKATSCMTLAVR